MEKKNKQGRKKVGIRNNAYVMKEGRSQEERTKAGIKEIKTFQKEEVKVGIAKKGGKEKYVDAMKKGISQAEGGTEGKKVKKEWVNGEVMKKDRNKKRKEEKQKGHVVHK